MPSKQTCNPDSEFFITIVTDKRKSWFTTDVDLEIARDAMGVIRDRYGLKFIAWVILPDHLHWIISAPREWKYSSFHKYVKRGVHPENWGDGANVVVQGAEYD